MYAMSRFQPEEWNDLAKSFQVGVFPLPNPTASFLVEDLRDGERCAAYLDRLTEALQSPSRLHTASLFAKRYAFIAVGPSIFAMTRYNKGLKVSLANAYLGPSEERRGMWPPQIYLDQVEVTEPEAGKREQWREDFVGSLFAGNITKLWRQLSAVARVPMPILWENTAVRLFSLYEKRLASGASEEERVRIEDDFAYLVNRAQGAVFGESQNPFVSLYGSEALADLSPTDGVRMRKTCCLYYQVSAQGEYCSACPRAK
ncbi:IucA/IucC family C-terminal-domain containing protein [Brevibacillus migulae]|uniref:IucA/IucC family C-terminal-domain containing protein n=1 Tax=Brevibacillus migulae TaxID=1644114 RepID=UPI00106E084B|nr:IucA/IucC family C-terminal-domain containing protein [Brevibacillus migulae]